MFSNAQQWRKQFEEMKDEYVNSVATLSSELHKLKKNHDHYNFMDETNYPLLNKDMCEVIEEQIEEIIELKVSEQSNSEITCLPATFKLSNFTEIKNTEQWFSSYFFVHDGSYQMNFEVLASGYGDGKGTHVSLILGLMKGPHDDNLQQLGHWPLTGTFTLEVLNNFTEGNNHFSRQMIFSAYTCSECSKRVIDDYENKEWSYPQFISHHIIEKSSCSKNLYINVSYTDTNPVIPCNQIAPVTLRMPSKKMKNNEKWYSSPFYAFKGGYQVCLKVYTAGFGSGKGSHLSVYIHLMKGPHDVELQQSGRWPLKGVFNIKLLNQFSGNHHQRKVTFPVHNVKDCNKRVVKGDINVGCGIDKFLSLDDTSDYFNKNNFYDFEVSYEDVPNESSRPADPLLY